MLIDDGELTGRLSSTVVDVTEGRIEVVGEGEIPESRLKKH